MPNPFRFLAGTALPGLLLACGSGEIDLSEINPGNVLDARPTTLRDGGDLVTGTVVQRTEGGELLEETEYRDGFPNGRQREWYANGQPKLDRTVEYQDRKQYGGRLLTVGPYKSWCENGTLESEGQSDAEGNPTGVSQTWNCAGQPLSYVTRPFGLQKSWISWQGNEQTVLTSEATTREGGGFEGERKTYHPENGKPRELENWKDGKLEGEYKRWAVSGEVEEAGTYRAGKKAGAWVTMLHGYESVTDYETGNFIDLEYAAPFAQAAGIDLSAAGAAMPPLREYQVDLDKIRYYVAQGLVDPKKKLTLAANANAEEFSSSYWSYPYIRASRGALPLLVELGADPKAIDTEKRSRLHYCIYSLADPNQCSAAEVKRLLDLGLDVKQADLQGETPLHALLVSTSHWGRQVPEPDVLAVMQVLLAAGSDPDAPTRMGLTPLMIAVQQKRFPVAAVLLEKSQKPGLTTQEGFNLIHLAFVTPDMQQFRLELTDDVKSFVELAAKKGVDPAQKIGDQGTLKEIAEKSGAIDLAQYLATLGRT